MLDIRMKPGFMYLGTTAEEQPTEVPMPNGGTFSTAYSWQTQQSADGSIVGQQLGRSRAAQEMTWEVMNCETWWALNTWIEENGMVFFASFFDYNVGQWRTRQFYVEAVTCSPYRPGAANGPSHGKPLYLRDCSFTVNDMGAAV